MATETRSHDGCWTCRLRKKKCDEKRPICTECMCVGLECHGFGEKPAWMDRGARQKAQAAKMKQKVAQATRSRRINQIRDQHESSLKRISPQTRTVSKTALGTSTSTSHTTTAPSIPVTTTTAHHDTVSLAQAFSDPFHPPDKLQYTAYHRDEINPSGGGIDHLPVIDPSLAGFPSTFNDMTFLSDNHFDLPEIESISADDGDNDSSNHGALGVPESLRAGYPLSRTGMDLGTAPGANSMLSITNVEDAVLLAHYMEKVFHWQFRFSCSSSASVSSFNQGYCLWLMSKCRPLYLVTQALSSSYRSLHRTVEEPQNGAAHLIYEEHMDRYDRAGEELQRSLKNPKAADDVSMLACIVSFISSSFLHPGKIDWSLHLKAGTSMIAPWLNQQIEMKQEESPKTPEDASRDFFTGSIIRFDILSAITRDTAPSLLETYRAVLHHSARPSPILLETVCGCQNWVFEVLLDVYLLRDWKRTTRAAGLLSLWELTAKANLIKTDLERRITSNLILMNKCKQELEMRKDDHDHLHSPSRYSRYDLCVVTHTFACAVSVLLEVTVSGAYPQLPEMKQKVGRSLESFAYIDDLELLDVLCWPLFVVGCVTEPEQYEFFRRLLSSSSLVVRSVSLADLLELLEKCWKARESGEMGDDCFDFSRFRASYKTREVLIA